MKLYELCTVTYCTISMPFLVMHTLQALVEEKCHFPDVAVVLCRDMYIDNRSTDANSLLEAKEFVVSIDPNFRMSRHVIA